MDAKPNEPAPGSNRTWKESALLCKPTQERDSYAPLLKLVLVVSLLALVASVAHWLKRPRTQPAVDIVESPPQEAYVVAPSPTPVRRVIPERVTTAPRQNTPRPDPRAYGYAWTRVVTVHKSNYLVAVRLPELEVDAGVLIARLGPRVSYHLPMKFMDELHSDFATIAGATNGFIQHDTERQAIAASFERDRQDYLRQAKAADEQWHNEAAALQQKQLQLQRLYMDRKQEFEEESRLLKPQLQDHPDVFNRKLPAYEAATGRFASDMKELESTLFTLREQIHAKNLSGRQNVTNLEAAFQHAEREVSGKLNALSNRLHQQLVEVNTSIREYNKKLAQYGTPAQ